jgi:hypothetical protein
MTVQKYVKKQVSRAKKYVKKRYTTKGNLNLSQITKDVLFLKSVINAEKKEYYVSANALTVGQFNGATTSGVYTADITPIPAQTSLENGRTGDSIKVCSAVFKFQFYQQSATSSTIKFRIVMLEILGQIQVASTSIYNFLQDNTWTNASIQDYSSNWDSDYRTQFRIVFDRKYTMPPDNFSAETSVKDIQINLKLNHHCRFDNGSTNIKNGQYMMFILCDSGNCSTSVATTATNVPITVINSGLKFNYGLKYFYYDN